MLTTSQPSRGERNQRGAFGQHIHRCYAAKLDDVAADISVVLCTTSMSIHQLLRLGRGAIIELDASEEDEVRIPANNVPVARGTVVVSGNRIAVEVKQFLPNSPDAA